MPIDARTAEVLREALQDEYKARATYRSVIAAFGKVRPFINIVEAEDRHARALLGLFERFGVAPPDDTWAGRVKAPGTLAEACRAAVAAEIENDAMYERLLQQVSDAEVLQVLRRLQEASRERHLPAFRRCLARETGQPGDVSGPPSGHPRRARLRRRGG